ENGIPSVRGIALVNGIPMIRGIALVNNLEVDVSDGEVTQVKENGVLVNGLNMSKGIALVNGVALVNGTELTRGVALVNGIALVNEAGSGEDVVNLENMNFLASGIALVNGGIPSVRGIALVNGLEGVDGEALKIAAGTVQPDSSIIYEDVSISNGIALVNGLAYVRGIALVNGDSLTNGVALVNSSSINDNSNTGTILVFDATDIGAAPEDVSLSPISFITGSTAGTHWIVPGTYLSNNFEISYGLGTLTINEADLTITAEDDSKTYGQTDPELTYTSSGLFTGDTITGELNREEGEDAGDYHILQGSLNAGDNYAIHYDSATLTIDPAHLTVNVVAENKVYDGTRDAVVSLFDDRLNEDTLDISFTSALFVDKKVGENKEVTVLGISVAGSDAGNYLANATADTTASITAKALEIGITAADKIYDRTTVAATTAFVAIGLVDGDTVMVSSTGGEFDNKIVGADKPVTANVSAYRC
ncbi:MAG: hypothetical protein KAR16_01805, partial [Bacteroidales bacterium]|nr:hypothetical protein [Bacteroidales bacterium]